jgi:hypothetical protein
LRRQLDGHKFWLLAPTSNDGCRRANGAVVGQEFMEAGRKYFEISRPALSRVME